MKEKKEVYKVKPLTEGKKNIIATLIQEYDIKTAEDIQDWQNRPLEKVYPVIFTDATREDNRIKKIAAYVVLGIIKDGMKEVLTLEIGENESSKYWLGVLNALKNRGVNDIMVICADGLTGIKEAIATAFP